MDESLANGFKNQFFRHVQEELETAFGRANKVNTKVDQYSKLSNWVKFTSAIVPAFGDAVITHCNGGTKRKPYFAISVLGADDARQYNTWEEKCLTCSDELFNFNPAFYDLFPTSAYIGEHAVKRLFQRSFDTEKHRCGEITHMEIMKELVHVPLWSNYWLQLFYFLKKRKYDIQKLTPIIPTPKGLLLCEFSTDSCFHLDIRTFVNTALLNEQQAKLRDVLLIAGNGLAQAPISFTSTLKTTGLAAPIEDLHKISMNLVNDTALLATQISNDALVHPHLTEFVTCSIDQLRDYLDF